MRALRAEPVVFLWAALLLLTVPLRWLLAGVLAMAVHECFHFAVLRMLGGQAWGLQLGPRGMVMETGFLTPGRELVCALAGPLGSFSLLLLGPLFPRTAFCALVQGLYNLLPLYPLDGGRILASLARLLGVEWILPGIQKGCTVLLFLLALAGMLWLRLGLLPILGVIALFLGKRPCKPGPHGVQ